MADGIQVIDGVEKVEANLVPMHIQFSGAAKAKEFFTPSKSTEKYGEHEVESAYFRGCKLMGKRVELGDAYRGYLVNPSESLCRVENEMNINNMDDEYNGYEDGGADVEFKTIKTYTTVASFDSIHVYGHDTMPESNSQWMLVNEWKSVSDIIHG